MAFEKKKLGNTDEILDKCLPHNLGLWTVFWDRFQLLHRVWVSLFQ